MNTMVALRSTHAPPVELRVALLSSTTQNTVGRTRVAIGGRRPKKAKGEDLIQQLYAEHGRSLLAYATRLTGDRAAAEDVVQETLVRAWKHADDLVDGNCSLRGWLLTVARHLVTDRVRARAVRPVEVADVDERSAVETDHSESVVN